MASNLHRCGCYEGCKRGCSCQKKGNEWPCPNCGCCYERNKMEPPLRKNKPPETCQKKFNLDANWHLISTRRCPHIRTEPLPQSGQPHGQSQLLRGKSQIWMNVIVMTISWNPCWTTHSPSTQHPMLALRHFLQIQTTKMSGHRLPHNNYSTKLQSSDRTARVIYVIYLSQAHLALKSTDPASMVPLTTAIITKISTTERITARITHALRCQKIIVLHTIWSIPRYWNVQRI